MDNRRNSKKLRRRGTRTGRIVLVIIAAFVLIGAAAALVFGLRGCRTAASKRSLPFRADSEYCYTLDGFLYLDGRSLNFVSLEDENKNYSVNVDYSSVSIAGTDKLKVVYSSSSLQVVGTPFDNVIEGSIKKVACGSKYVGAYVENPDDSHSLRVFNSAGSQCYRKDLTNTELLDFGFEGGESASLWMSELLTTGGAVSTTITTYDLNRESITGVISVQGQVVKQVFMTKKSIFALCTDNIIRFDRETNDEAYRLRCRGYDCVDFSPASGRLFMLLRSEGSETAPLNVLSVKEDANAEESYIPIAGEGDLGCFLLGGRAVSVRSDKLIIRNQKGEVEKTVPFDAAITGGEKLDESNLLIIRGNETLLYTLK